MCDFNILISSASDLNTYRLLRMNAYNLNTLYYICNIFGAYLFNLSLFQSIAAKNLSAGPDQTRNLICPNPNFEEKKTDGSYIIYYIVPKLSALI